MIIKGIIFDLDGTLLDTIEDIADSVNYALGRFGHAAHSVDSYRYFVGEGFPNLIKRSVPPEFSGDDEYTGKVLVAAREEYKRIMMHKTRPYDGIPELLRTLSGKKVRLSVLSNKPNANTVEIVRHYFSEITFDYIAGAFPDKPIKPDPLLALEAARAMGCAESECVIVGDSCIDIYTGKNAGMRTIGAAWGFRGRSELEEAGAGYVADTPHALGEYLMRVL